MNTRKLNFKERLIRAQIIHLLIESNIANGMQAISLWKKSYQPTFVRELKRSRKIFGKDGKMTIDAELAIVNELEFILPEITEHLERTGRNKERMERLGTAKLVKKVVHDSMKKKSRR